MTPAQIARARYDEAHQIRDAWEHRIRLAQAAHDHARKTGGDELATRRQLNAVEIEFEEATEALRLAQHLWITAANKALWPRRKTA